MPVAAAVLRGALNDSVLPLHVPLGFAQVLEPHASEIRFFCQHSHSTAIDIYFPIFVWINAICWKLLCYQINKTYGPCLNTNEVVRVIISLGFWSCTEGGPGSPGCPYRGTPGCSGCAGGTGVGNVSYRSLWRKYQLFLYLEFSERVKKNAF